MRPIQSLHGHFKFPWDKWMLCILLTCNKSFFDPFVFLYMFFSYINLFFYFFLFSYTPISLCCQSLNYFITPLYLSPTQFIQTKDFSPKRPSKFLTSYQGVYIKKSSKTILKKTIKLFLLKHDTASNLFH